MNGENMPKYNYYECPDCNGQIRGKRNLFKHMVESHGYRNEIHAISRFYNKDLNEDGHFYCHNCGKEISDSKVYGAVVDKGKNFVSSFCCQKCSIESFNKLGLDKAHENLKVQMKKHKDGKPSQYDNFFACGSKNWELARKDPEKLERMMKGLRIGWEIIKSNDPDILRRRLVKKLSNVRSIKRLYIVRASLDGRIVVKVGIGNPWRRWKCISLLLSNLIVEELLETPKPFQESGLIEFDIHQDLRFLSIRDEIPNIHHEFIQGDYVFKQNTAPTEWYCEEAFDRAVDLAINKYHLDLESSLEGFRNYMKEEDIKLYYGE